MKQDFISIGVPIFNESTGISRLIDETMRLPLKKEVIIVDDGSTNKETLRIINVVREKYPEIIIVTNKRNFGKSASIQIALKRAKGNLFVILDGDGELDPKDLIALYQDIKKKNARFANGARRLTKTTSLHFSQLVTRLARTLSGSVVYFFYGVKIRDVLSGYKLFYTKDFREHVFSTIRFGLESDLLVATLNNKRKIIEVDVDYSPRSYKEGKRINIFDSFEIFLCLLRNIKFGKSIFQTPFEILSVGILLWCFAFSVYNLHANSSSTSDSLPNNFTSVNIVYNNRLDLTNFIPYFLTRHQKSVVTKNNSGVFYAKTPVINGIVSAPYFYLFDKQFGIHTVSANKFLQKDYETYYQSVGKYYAALLASISVLFMFLTINTLFRNIRYALFGALSYGFATMTYSTASQGNWQHAPSLFLITISFYLFILFLRSKRQLLFTIITLLLALAALIRIVNIFFFLGIIGVLFFYKPYKKLLVYPVSIYCAVLVGWQTITSLMGIPGGYNGEIVRSIQSFNIIYATKVIISLLVSPNVGLLIFCPLSVLSFLGIYKMLRTILKNKDERSKPFYIFLIVSFMSFFLILLFNAFWWAWEGGFSWGPRLLTEAIPFLVYLGVYYMYTLNINALKLGFAILFFVFFIFSTLIHIVGVYADDNEWHNRYYKEGTNRMTMAWQMHPSILWYYIVQRKIFFTQQITKENEKITIKKNYYYIDPFHWTFTTKKTCRKYI